MQELMTVLGNNIVLLVLIALAGLLVVWLLWGRTRAKPAQPPVAEPEAPKAVEPPPSAVPAPPVVVQPAPVPIAEPAPEATALAPKAKPKPSPKPKAVSKPVADPAPKPKKPRAKPPVQAEKPAAEPAPVEKPAAPPPAAPVAAPAMLAIGVPGAAGDPDSLSQIKGLGPKLNTLLTGLGITRFDQIAAWTADDIARVDEHLGAFKGRIERDSWIEQAGLLARGAIADFEARYGKLDSENK